jgi:hypothetical protein
MDHDINEMDRKDIFEGFLCDPEWPEIRRAYLETCVLRYGIGRWRVRNRLIEM